MKSCRVVISVCFGMMSKYEFVSGFSKIFVLYVIPLFPRVSLFVFFFFEKRRNFINTLLRSINTKFEIMRTLLLLVLTNFLISNTYAQIWKRNDSVPQKRIVQFGAGFYSGVYKIEKEKTDYKSENIGIDIGIEARVLITFTKHFSITTGFIQSRKETILTVFDLETELYNIQNISSQIPVRVNYSFFSKKQKPIADAYIGVSRVFSAYTTQFEYIDFFRLSNPSLPSTIGPYYMQTITHKRNDFSFLLGLQRGFPVAKNFHFVAFAEYEYVTRDVSFNSFFNQHLTNKPDYEPNLKLRPTSLKLGIYFLI